MAKDGTNRGGRRPRSGPSKDSLADKTLKGRPAEVLAFPAATLEPNELPVGEDLNGVDMPKPSAYLSAMQRDGKPLGADAIFKETMKWLHDRGCDQLVNPRQVESYSEAYARYIQCSEALSKYGFISKHPTTKLPTTSPYVAMEIQYQKQANLIWYEIFSIVKENSLEPYKGMPQSNSMEALLSGGREGW